MSENSYIGEIMMFAGMRTPAGWIPCDGRRLPAAAYAALYSVIGTTYGGEGGDFLVPDMRGYLPTAPTSRRRLGSSEGSSGDCTVSLSSSNIPSHSHEAVFVGEVATIATSLSLPIKKRLSSGTSEGSVTALAGGYIGEGPAGGLPAGAIFVPPGSTADTIALAPISGHSSIEAKGKVEISIVGGGNPFSVPIPTIAVQFLICAHGLYPTAD